MRAIKFRGRRPDNGEWVYGFIARYRDKEEKWGIKESEEHGYWVVDPSTVGQFTGLHDKNGKEIYEGDIVAANCDTHNSKNAVVWGGDYPAFDLEPFVCYENNSLLYCICDPDSSCEVIGNIHDNPKLLQTK